MRSVVTDHLVITLFDGGVCERHHCSWEDVLNFFSILEPGEGYTAVLVTNLEQKEVLSTKI